VANIQNFIQYCLSEKPAATTFYADCTKTHMILCRWQVRYANAVRGQG
jgi:hypothetical protein